MVALFRLLSVVLFFENELVNLVNLEFYFQCLYAHGTHTVHLNAMVRIYNQICKI